MVILWTSLETCVLEIEQMERKIHSEKPVQVDTAVLSSPQEFWSSVEATISASEEQDTDILKLQQTVARMKRFSLRCTHVIDSIRRGKILLDDLESKHETVYEKTNSLHETCRHLLEEQQGFQKILVDIQEPMEYFQELSRIGGLLGVPVNNRLYSVINKDSQPPVVRQLKPDSPQFFKEIARLDECIDFVEEHPHFKDYQEYCNKFKQLYTRGLSMVRNMIVDSIESSSMSIRLAIETKLERVDSVQMLDRDSPFLVEVHSLLYHRFGGQTQHLREYISEIEDRSSRREAFDALKAVHSAYCASRLDLLQFCLGFNPELKESRGDVLTTLRLLCPFFLNLCTREVKLYWSFFSKVEPPERTSRLSRAGSSLFPDSISDVDDPSESSLDLLVSMLAELCGSIYDMVRPAIVKIHSLELLCETVRVITHELLEGQVRVAGEAGEALEVVLLQILHDVQERLIFAASTYVTSEVSSFQPTEAAIDYPKLLENTPDSKIWSGCYKSLENTLLFLGMIFRCVEMQTFEELTQEAVHGCTASLKRASLEIGNKGKKTDAELFLIKHLLILREQISPFNTHLTLKEVELDFRSTTRALSRFFSSSRQMFSREHNAFVDLVYDGVPTVTEMEVDCKRDLETELKECCERFIVRSYEQVTFTLTAFLQRASIPLADGILFHQQEFATPERLTQLVSQAVSELPGNLSETYHKMTLYLANNQTQAILFKPIKVNIFTIIAQLTNCIEANYPPENANCVLRLVSDLRSKINNVGSTPDSNDLVD